MIHKLYGEEKRFEEMLKADNNMQKILFISPVKMPQNSIAGMILPRLNPGVTCQCGDLQIMSSNS